jgi:hypothetical protein
MRFRKLRIAWLVVWGLAAVLLIVLWVRSYVRTDVVQGPLGGNVACSAASMHGRLVASIGMFEIPIMSWLVHSSPSDEQGVEIPRRIAPSGFALIHSVGKWVIHVPHWFALVGCAAFAAVPWLPWWSNRFSLRTLLIATTLVAVVLGLIVYFAR